ncbi:MAG: hypothetical protein AAGK71_15125 [Pseudomonadota bacterium]
MRPYSISPYEAFFAPWSGPVTQAFKIWSDWFETVGQIGLVNINLGDAGDDELEREILVRAGSYGRQIGQVSDAVEVLLKHAALDRTKLSDEDIVALHKFKDMLERVKDCKP